MRRRRGGGGADSQADALADGYSEDQLSDSTDMAEREDARRRAMLEEATGSSTIPGTVEHLLQDDIARGRVIPMDIEEAATDWEEQRTAGDRPWEQLDAKTKAAWTRAYAAGNNSGETQERLLGQDTDLKRDDEAEQARRARSAGLSRVRGGAGNDRSSQPAASGTASRADGPRAQVLPATDGGLETEHVGAADGVSVPPAVGAADSRSAGGRAETFNARTQQNANVSRGTAGGGETRRPATELQPEGGSAVNAGVPTGIPQSAQTFGAQAVRTVSSDRTKVQSASDGSEGSGRASRTAGAEAAATGVSRSTSGALPKVSATGGLTAGAGGTDPAARTVDVDELFDQPGFSRARRAFDALGIRHALDWVSQWKVTNNKSRAVAGGLIERLGSRYVVTLKDAATVGDSMAEINATHEVGHAVDMAQHGGVYSSQPELAFDDSEGRLRAHGVVARAALDLYKSDDAWPGWKELLAYPFNLKKYPDMRPAAMQQVELFAQLFAAYSHPGMRAVLEGDAPVVARFMKEVVDDLKQTRPRQLQTEATAAQRATAFAQRSARRIAAAQGRARVAGTGETARLASATDDALAGHLEQLAQQEDFAARMRAKLPQPAQSAWTNIRDKLKKWAPYLLTNTQLAEQYKEVASLREYVALQQALTVERAKQAQVFHNVSTQADKLPKAAKERLNAIMQRATLQEMHPDLPFDDKLNSHLTEADRLKYAELASKYASMKAAFPQAAEAYQSIKRALNDSYDARGRAYSKLVDYTFSKRIAEAYARGDEEAGERLAAKGREAEQKYQDQLGRVKGPYFPLMRFGEYLAIGESAQYRELKDQPGSREQLEKLKRDPKHYVVSAHADRASQEAAVKAYRAQGLEARSDMANQHFDRLQDVTKSTLDHLTDAVARQFDAETAGAVNEALTDVFMRSVPEMSALRREAERKGVEGADPDMLRAFAAAGEQSAFYVSRLMYASDMADAMFRMKREVKGDTDLQHVRREMEQRMALDMKFAATPVQDAIASASWVYHLGMSPAFLMMNATQPYLVTGPVLAGKFGVTKASKALGVAARDALAVLKTARWHDGKWDWWSGISEESIPGESVNEDRKVIRALMKRGIVDDGLQSDLNMFAQGDNRALGAFKKIDGWATQQIEVANRLTTALASFRLARQGGMAYEQAVEYAMDTTLQTQMDYSTGGSARVMREGGGVPMAKLVFQFRRFQQGMLYLFGTNIRKAFGTGQEAREARAAVGYLTLSSGLAAGATGLPFAGVFLGLANLFREPDDEDGDAETQLRNWLVTLTGDKDTARVLAKGLPALWGMDLSKRLGQGDLASAFPMARWDGATGRDQASELLFNVFGPAAGLGAQMYDGLQRMKEGDWGRGAEKLLPKQYADLVRAARYDSEGLTDSRGGTVLGPDEIDAWDKLYRVLGTQTTKEADYYEGTAALKNVEEAVKERKTRIQHAFNQALRSGDMGDVRAQIVDFNEDHPAHRILPKDEAAWRQAARRSERERDESGIRLGRRDKGYADITQFAR